MRVHSKRISKTTAILGALCVAVAALWSSVSKAETQVYLLRGWFGAFSTGLDTLADDLRSKGVKAETVGHLAWKSTVANIIKHRAAGKSGALVLIGHSQGANNVIEMARILEKNGIAVDLLVTLAPLLQDPIPGNVARAINYYNSPGWGAPVKAEVGYRGNLSNVNLGGDLGIAHIAMDKSPNIQAEIERAILGAADAIEATVTAHAITTRASAWLARASTLLLLAWASVGAQAAPVRMVAIGASNTHGWYVGNAGAYPAQLQALLRAKQIDAHVTNAGVPFDTTAMMLRRLDREVPDDTKIVILQPGANDRRFLGTREQRAANIAEMERRLRARGIKVVVYDDEIPLRYYTIDFIHLTREGHAMIAAALLHRVMPLIEGRHKDAAPTASATSTKSARN